MNRVFVTMLAIMLIIPALAISQTTESDVNITLMKLDPFPGEPGSNMELTLKVENTGDIIRDLNVVVEETYPFSITNGPERFIGTLSTNKEYANYALLRYNIDIDENALDEDYELIVKYTYSDTESHSDEERIDISVSVPTTNFDIVVEGSEDMVSFSVVNTGKQGANSVIVEVPEQSGVSMKGPNRAVIGTLDVNDFSLVSFEMSYSDSPVTVVVDYTDNIGTRRSFTKTLNIPPKIETDTDSAEPGILDNSYIFIVTTLIFFALTIYFFKKSRAIRK